MFVSRLFEFTILHFRSCTISTLLGICILAFLCRIVDAFAKFDQDPSKIVWVSDERKVGWNYDKEIPKIGGRTIPWLADFLKIVFARNIFRSNSSFSLFASWISNCENIYSPWLHTYSPGEVVDFKFVRGNHPHWMSVKGVHASYQFAVKNDVNKKEYIAPRQAYISVSR